jgi:spore photoproduct lyase
MISRIYIEEDIVSHPRAIEICNKFPGASIVYCHKYSEIFNRKSQNFRLQKISPALILAKKSHNHVLPAPEDFGIGGDYNFYFSHMMNCLYDCRYCFLQGMYQSANYVLFVNYEDFSGQIKKLANTYPDKNIHFFSGYDCDSLAFEPVSGFVRYILPEFSKLTNSLLELRTKSTQIRSLLSIKPVVNCIVAYSLNPAPIARALEHKAPDLNSRLNALHKLQHHGWKIGLRFDPLIYDSDYKRIYTELFAEVFKRLDPGRIHSVSIGTFRLPKKYHKKIMACYAEEKLFASPLQEQQGIVQYKTAIRHDLINHCYENILNFLPENKIFPCEPLKPIADTGVILAMNT